LLIPWRLFLVEAVRNSTRQSVLLFATLLSFSNGASLFAATICRPEAIAVQCPDVFPKDIVPRDPVSGPAEDRDSGLTSSVLAYGTPQERGEATTALDGSASLLGNSFIGPLEKLPRSGTESKGLNREDGSQPMPPQPQAPSRGETGAPGTMPTIGPKDQQVSLFTVSAATSREWEESLGFDNVRHIPDSCGAGLFRPPRERF
jgi:hypothetical protein